MIIEQIPNYRLIIQTNDYTGNFKNELVSYALGILDNEQMELGYFHGDYEMDLFWKEEFNSERQDYDDEYELKDEYLMETYQEVHNWMQMTFYHMTGAFNHSLAIQLAKPLNAYWEEIIIRRIKKFFKINPCRYDYTLPKGTKLLDLYLLDSNGNKIKNYM